MELFKAANQWATRPVDERFASIQELYDATKGYADIARESSVRYSDIRVEADGSEVRVAGKLGQYAKVTNWAFGQLSSIAGAPAGYLRQLPATLAAQNLNHGLKARVDATTEGRLLFHANGELLLRAAVSDRYSRIWNWEIAKRLLPLEPLGWYAPIALANKLDPRKRIATEADIRPSSAAWLKPGVEISPAGLYASDHDVFAFLVNDKARVNDGTSEGISQGIFVENSEVGASRFRLTAFGLRHVCGNHIVWGASNVREISIRHVGSNVYRWGGQLEAEFRRFSNESVAGLELKIAKAKKFTFAGDKDEILDTLFKKLSIPRVALEQSYEIAEKHEDVDGAPNTAWGLLQGLTRYSQTLSHTDTRTDLDKKAGKILEIAF